MTIRNLNWELETTFTRKQVVAMAEVAKFVGNIEKDLSAGFPSSCKKIDWKSVREVMTLFSILGKEDNIGYRALVRTVQDVNGGKVQLLGGKVVEVEYEQEPKQA